MCVLGEFAAFLENGPLKVGLHIIPTAIWVYTDQPRWVICYSPANPRKMQFMVFDSRMRLIVCALTAFLMLWGIGGCRGNVSDKKIDFIDLNQAMDLYDRGLEESEGVLFRDVRQPARFNDGHIKGARNIRVNEIDLRYDADPELLKYDNLVVYGENPGSASARAMASCCC